MTAAAAAEAAAAAAAERDERSLPLDAAWKEAVGGWRAWKCVRAALGTVLPGGPSIGAPTHLQLGK